MKGFLLLILFVISCHSAELQGTCSPDTTSMIYNHEKEIIELRREINLALGHIHLRIEEMHKDHERLDLYELKGKILWKMTSMENFRERGCINCLEICESFFKIPYAIRTSTMLFQCRKEILACEDKKVLENIYTIIKQF